MKRITSVLLAVATLVFAATFSASCSDSGGQSDVIGDNYYFFGLQSHTSYVSSGSSAITAYGSIMGADVNLVLSDEDNFSDAAVYSNAVSLWSDIYNMLISADASLSLSYGTSFVSLFNAAAAGETLVVDKTTYSVLSIALESYKNTDGYFNPAVYQSALLYGFETGSVKEPENLPEDSLVAAYMGVYSSFGDIKLSVEDGKYYVKKPDYSATINGEEITLKIDLGGIAKGWCADEANKLIKAAGFGYGYFNFGSSSMAVLSYIKDDEGEYTVGSRDARKEEGTPYVSFKVKNSLLSTSGDYEKYYEKQTESGTTRYCHIINPFTGSPISTGVASVTVVGGTAAEDDALTTALSCMGAEKAVSFMSEKYADRFYVMLYIGDDGLGKVITSDSSAVKIYNESYTFA